MTGVTAARLNLDVRVSALGAPELVRDYNDGAPQLAPFFAGFPRDLRAVRRVAAAVDDFFDAKARAAMKDAIYAPTAAARARLDSIAAGPGFFVATGQQAGLFGGPLFTIHKTLSAITLAADLERALGVPVAPLFWVAADDHDFAEVNHTDVVGADNDLHRIAVKAADDVARSMARRELGPDIVAAIETLRATLPNNEFAQEALGWIDAAYRPGRSVADAFAELLAHMFEHHDLLITSSAQPVVKRLAAPIVARELAHAADHEAAVRAQTDRLIAAGYHEQVPARADAAHVMYEDEDGRDRLAHEAGVWHLGRSKRPFELAELNALLDKYPERFSPSALLRPVVASAIFPTVAYVGGPAEISYFAQIGCLFDAHGVPMPLVQPRASIEIVEHKVQKVLDKFELTVADVHQPFDRLTSRVIRDQLPAGVTDTVSELREQIRAAYARLVDETEAIDPTLQGPLEKARNASHKTLADAEKKIVSHLKKKNEIGIEQLRKASLNLYPYGKSQERGLGAISYLARYGSALVDVLAGEISNRLDADAPAWQGVACD